MSINKGFTLIELMVAVSIFATVAVIAGGAVLSANAVNKKAQALKVVLDNLNFALDSMTLKLKKGGGYYCQTLLFNDPPTYPSSPDSQDCTSGGQAIAFKLEDDTKYIYQFNNSRLQFSQSPAGGGAMSAFTAITVEEIKINGGNFYVLGNCNSGCDPTASQPRVLVSIYGTAKVGQQKSDFAVQTTVSDRR